MRLSIPFRVEIQVYSLNGNSACFSIPAKNLKSTTRTLASRASISALSPAANVKPNKSMFERKRPALVLFGMTDTPSSSK